MEKRLEAWVDDELDAGERGLVEAHLETCDACLRQAELARALRDELRALPRSDAPRELVERVIRTARAEQSAPTEQDAGLSVASSRRRRAPRWGEWLGSPWRIAAVGTLAAALVVAIVLAPGGRGDSEVRTASAGSASSEAAPDVGGTAIGSTAIDTTIDMGAARAAQVDPRVVRRAADEARLALAYLSRASRRTGLELREELLSERLAAPAVEGLRALGLRPRARNRGPEERGHDET